MEKLKRVNPQVLLEFICFAAFAVFLFYLMAGNRYLDYLAPRMRPYLIFAAIMMTIWALACLPRLFQPGHRLRAAHCLILLLPLLLLLLPHSTLGASALSSGYVSLGSSVDKAVPSSEDTADPPSTTPDTETEAPEAPDTNTDPSADTAFSTEVPEGLDEANKTITISNDDFYPWLTEIFIHMKQYEGYQITVTGFVYRDDSTMAANEFVPARMLMSCCVADLTPVGIICHYDKAAALELESWITVTGTLIIGQYQGNDEPQLQVESIAPAEKPEQEYVYP